MGDSFAAGENCVSCRTSSYTIQQLIRLGLPVGHVAAGTGYTLEELQDAAAFIPWNPYLVFFQNAHQGVSDAQFVALCTSYNVSPFLRPLMTAAGLWYDPARYFEWVASPGGAIQQLFRCLETRSQRVGAREVLVEERLKPGYAAPPDLFWEAQAIGFGALTTYFGLGPSVVTWEPIDRGAAFRVRVPRRRPVRQLLSRVAARFRRGAPDDLRAALLHGHERSLRLEREAAARKQAERALRASEERLRRVTDAIPGIVYQYVLDPDGRQGFTFVSGGSTSLTGYSPEELVADPGLIWQHVLPEYAPGIQAAIVTSAQTGTPWHQEFQFRTKGGDIRWVRGHSVPEPPDATGRVVWNGILTDITAERTTAEALAATERRLTEVASNLPGVLFQFLRAADGTPRVGYVSDGIRGLVGYTPEEITHGGRNPFELVHPEQQQEAYRRMQASAEGLTEWTFEGLIRRADGRHIWLRTRATPTRTPDGGTVWNGVAIDVTDQKRAEEGLRERDDLLRKLSEQVPGVIYQYRQWPDGRSCFPYASEGIRTVYEVAPDEVRESAATVFARLHPDDLGAIAASIARSAETLEEWRCEYRVRLPARGERWLEGHAAPERLPDGSTLWHGHISDVTDRKRAEAALRESEERFRLAAEATGAGVWDHWMDRDEIGFSDQLRAIYGLPPDARITRPVLTRLIHPDDRPGFERVAAAAADPNGAGTYCHDHRIVRPDGEVRWVRSFGRSLFDSRRQPVRSIGIARDVTAQKETEDRLRDSEERYRTMFEANPHPMWVYDLHTFGFLAVNDAAVANYGYTREEFLGMTIKDIRPPEDVPALVANVAAVSSGFQHSGVWRHRLKDGRTIMVRIASHTMTFAGRPAELVLAHNVTDQLRAEEQLRESEEKLRTILDNEPECVKLLDREGRLLEMNPAGLRMIEAADLAQVRGAAVNCLVADSDRAAFDDLVASVFRGESLRLTFEMRGLAGTPRVLETHSVPLWSADRTEVRALLGVTRDVTDRVRAEQALRENEEQLRLAVETTRLGIWRHVIRTGRITLNERARAIFDLDAHEIGAEELTARFHPGDRERVRQEVGNASRPDGDGSFATEHRILTRDGTERWLSVRANIRFIDAPAGRLPSTVIGTMMDITERKRAEEALRDAEYRQRLALDAGRMGTWDWEIGSDLLVWDDREQALFGLPPGGFDGRLATFLARVHPDDRAAVRQVLADAAAGKDFDGEFRVVRPTGEVRWIHGSGAVYPGNGDRPARLIGTNYDVTDRVRAEEQIREANAVLQALTRIQREFLADAAPHESFDGLLGVLLRATASEYGFIGQVFRDPAGRPYLQTRAITDISWDDATRRFYAEGAPAGLVFANLNTLFGAVLTSGRPVIANDPAADPRRGGLPHGHPALNAFLGVPLFRGAELIGMAGLANRPGGYDEALLDSLAPILSTCASLVEAYQLRVGRQAAETALRASLGEKEAMLKEIHHRVKNNLQVISSLLNLQAERIADPTARAVFLESQSRVRAMALVHETLYGSESLARIELPRYLERLCDSLLQTFGGNERVTVERAIAPVGLDLDRALPVGLIVSELVSNALKYAFPGGRRGRLRVALAPGGEADLELSVSDDGVGLPPDLDFDRATSLGLYLVRVLTRQLRGTLAVDRTGVGATFTLRFPK